MSYIIGNGKMVLSENNILVKSEQQPLNVSS